MVKKLLQLSLTFYFCLNFITTSHALAQEAISVDLAKKIADYWMKSHYDKPYKTKEPVIYYNIIDDKPEVYAFTFYKGEGDIPSDQDILKRGRINYDAMLAAKQNLSTESERRKYSEYGEKIYRADEFDTIIVGAREERSPISTYHKGLPRHYGAFLFEAEDVAREALGTSILNLDRYFQDGLIFKFSDFKGNSVLVEVSGDHPAKVISSKEVEEMKTKASDYKKKLESGSEAWQERAEFERKRLENIKESWRKMKDLPSDLPLPTYTDSEGLVQLQIPKGWKKINRIAVSPFSSDTDFTRTYFQVKVFRTTQTSLSDEEKNRILSSLSEGKSKILNQTTSDILGTKAWGFVFERKSNRGEPRKVHEIYIFKNGIQVILDLEAAPELYENADSQFEEAAKTLKIL